MPSLKQSSQASEATLSAAFPLPSLLCPMRTSFLPPHEIGRCKPALDALKWRLWVGETLSSVSSPTSTLSPSAFTSARTLTLLHGITQR